MKKILVFLLSLFCLALIACEGEVESITYDVVFDSNGGTEITMISDIQFGDIVEKPTNPTKGGHNFIAWYSDEDLTEQWIFTQNPITRNLTLYAKWEEIVTPMTYTVMFDSNDGSDVSAVSNLSYGSYVSKPTNPTKDEYAFIGWFSDEDLTEQWSFTQNPVTRNLTLYAKWEEVVAPITYTVTFDSNDGSDVSATSNLSYGSYVSKPTNPTKDEYAFIGWFSDEGLTEQWSFTQNPITRNLTLYAKWEEVVAPITYTVTFDSNDGSAVSAVINLLHGSYVSKPTNPTKDEHTFIGWFSDEGLTEQWSFTQNPITRNLTLYAKWEEVVAPATYTITFESNDGSIIPAISNLPNGSYIGKPANPIKDNYNFIGWFSDEDLTEQWSFTQNPVTRNLTLYAKWEEVVAPITYTVTFNSNGGSQVSKAESLAYGSFVTKPADPTKNNNKFEGWFSDVSLIEPWIFSQGRISNNITLYAKWSSPLTTISSPIIVSDINSIYNLANQATVQALIDELKNTNVYTPEKPLIISNPFGANVMSTYVYFITSAPVSVSYTLSSPGTPDFTRIVGNKGNEFTQNHEKFSYIHEFLALGYIPNTKMTLTINCYYQTPQIVLLYSNSFDNLIMTVAASHPNLIIEKIDNEESLSNGLFFVMGTAIQNNFIMYDNYGFVRGNLRSNYSNTRVILDNNGNFLYDYIGSGIAKVNFLGKCLNIYTTPNYLQHHDIIFGGNNDILKLASRIGLVGYENSDEDIILSIDLDTGFFKELLDFRSFFPGYEFQRNNNDWLHINSIDLMEENGIYSLLVSGRELSVIIKVDDIYNTPNIAWIMTDNAMFTQYLTDNGLNYPILIKTMRQESDDLMPNPNLGQHTISFKEKVLGGYIIYFYNNLYSYNLSENQFDYNNLNPDVVDKIAETFGNGTFSYLETYFIDENNGECYLISSIEVAHSSITSSMQYLYYIATYNGVSTNIVSASAYNTNGGIIQEFDQDGNELLRLRATYNYYRALKYYI